MSIMPIGPSLEDKLGSNTKGGVEASGEGGCVDVDVVVRKRFDGLWKEGERGGNQKALSVNSRMHGPESAEEKL